MMKNFEQKLQEEKLEAAAARYLAQDRSFKVGDKVIFCQPRIGIREGQLAVVVEIRYRELLVLTWIGERISEVVIMTWEVVHELQ